MERATKIAEDCVRDAADDYVGLWQITTRVRREFGQLTNQQVKQHSLSVVRRIIEGGLRPGDYFATGFHFWKENNIEAIIARIEEEWEVERGDPTLANPICWFAPNPK
jgi:hypothetical protein